MHFTSDDSKVPKNKPCKRNNRQSFANTEYVAKVDTLNLDGEYPAPPCAQQPRKMSIQYSLL